MHPRTFTGNSEPWISLLEIEVCKVRFQRLCTEGLSGKHSENLHFIKMCHHVEAQAETFGVEHVFGGDFLEV